MTSICIASAQFVSAIKKTMEGATQCTDVVCVPFLVGHEVPGVVVWPWL